MVEALDIQYCLAAQRRVVGEFPDYEISWLKAYRDQSLTQFESCGLPTDKDENWKYTNTRALTKSAFEFSSSASSNLDSIPVINDLESHRLVFVDGILSTAFSDMQNLQDSVFVADFATAIASRGDLIESWLGKALPENAHGFSHLNGAFLSTGAVIEVPAGVKVELPIEVIYISTGDVERVVQPRNLVVMGEDSQAVVIERFANIEHGKYLNNCVTELFLQARSKLEFCRLQEESSKASQVGGLFANQLADSILTANVVSLDGLLIRNDIHLSMSEPGAACHLNGLAVTDGRQHVDNFTQVNHLVEKCVSKELFKGVLDGRSRNVFHGRIVVAKDAQQTDSQQQNQNLLLSRDAEIDTKPQLEIYADDVKCSHGATVGQLDPDSLFYLRTRGIDPEAARGMLTYAFAYDALQGISNQALKKHIELKVSSSLREIE